MRLCLVRHGIAVDGAAHAGPDDTRPLTGEGREKTARAARGLAALGVAPDVIVASPLARALETAQLVARELGDPPLRTAPELAPEADPALALAWLAGLGAGEVLAVGHRPHLDLLLAAALGLSGRPVTALRKAGAALVEGPPGAARLAWLLEPGALRRLAGA